MQADLTRSTFRREKHYSGVRMQQGRVQLDADWNEHVDIGTHLDETTRTDAIGACGAPNGAAGFGIFAAPGGADLLLSAGRMYVDGTLCELEASPIAAASVETGKATLATVVADGRELEEGDWLAVSASGVGPLLTRLDSVDASTLEVSFAADLELSSDDVTSLQAAGDAVARRVTSYLTQPDLPGAEDALDQGTGTYFAYLDAWQRHVTALGDGDIREVALGGPDTATRTQTVWQVKLERIGDVDAAITCSSAPAFGTFIDRSTGALRARAQPETTQDDLCTIPPGAGFRRLENQLYRAEIHDPGTLGADATFKWSRENGSVVVSLLAIDGDKLTVSSLGRDEVLGFAAGNWVELTDDTHELAGLAGTLVRLAAPEGDALVVDPTTATGSLDLADFPVHPKVRRWDDPDGSREVELAADNDGFLRLEDGVEIRFEAGRYNAGDYWLIPARTAGGDVEWPESSSGDPVAQPPGGIVHHYCPLALLRLDETWTVVDDCRPTFPPLTAIEAEDVAFDNAVCGLVTTDGEPADTVQEALDVLCESHTLRHHNAFLHGWGIVSGLKVVCDGTDRSQVTVREGWVIDRAGNDIQVQERTLPFMKMVDQHDATPPAGGPILKDGVGDAWLVWDPKTEGEFAPFVVEPYDPDWNKELEDRLATTLLMEFYEDSILDVRRFVERELTPPPGQENDPAGPQQELSAALGNLFAQRVNPQAGQHLLLTPREHELLKKFYAGLKNELSLETFCGLFDTARPYPDDFPAAIQGLQTIFGRGQHLRVRPRPGGREAYSVGPGINPARAATVINRWDLEKGVLRAQIDPLAGVETIVRRDQRIPRTNTGAGSVSDVAFLDDGKTIVVTAPTRNGQDTLFRSGTVRDDGIDWGDVFTICDLRVVSLATTVADRAKVYAIAHKPEGKKFVGDGLYRIDPAALAAGTQPVRVGEPFNATGHLRLAANGEGWATEAVVGQDVATYTSVRHFPNVASVDGASDVVSLEGLKGRDDIAVFHSEDGAPATTLYAVCETASGPKVVVAYQGTTRVAQVQIEAAATAHRLEPYAPAGMLLVTSEDGYAVRLVDMRTNAKVTNFVPMQLGPIAIASDPARNRVLVLNYLSSTLVVGDGNLFAAEPAFPVAALAAYRQAAVNAYNDLLARFLEYLKDCLCEHLLVASPDTTAETRLYLCAVTIRRLEQQSRVYKVCNLSRRRYVKSLPVIGHWLSLVPVLPFLDLLVERFCCWLLPDQFDRYAAADFDENASQSPQTRFKLGTARQGADTAQAFIALGMVGQLFGKFLQFGKVARDRT
jgi:Family of unknown function (DUF6519)